MDPYNLIITGVGGQGNVLASRLIGNMLSEQGYYITIGESFGAAQRGGAVESHIRVSAQRTYSPQIPKGKAHMVVALEPTEAIRILRDYGNPGVKVLSNMRPVYSMGVICGEQSYPSTEKIKECITASSKASWFVNSTDEALKLGNPIFGNIILIGALAGTNALPLDHKSFEKALLQRMKPDKIDVNLKAFDIGKEMTSA
ncbi:indolepyruvate oxidoreductase subunit beta [Desulfocicer vacuolatum]|nr:indolepyruvate oxidoreductase subunit beta [Desulfocicer vacuolatum]